MTDAPKTKVTIIRFIVQMQQDGSYEYSAVVEERVPGLPDGFEKLHDAMTPQMLQERFPGLGLPDILQAFNIEVAARNDALKADNAKKDVVIDGLRHQLAEAMQDR